MNRRQFNVALGRSVVALQMAWLGGCDKDAAPAARSIDITHADARAALVATARDLAGIEFLGPVCDRQLGINDPLGELFTRLDAADESLLDALRKRMSQDFNTDDVIDIDGWRLSYSECLLMAGGARLQGLSEPRPVAQAAFREAEFITVERWGPDRTIEGEIFNPIGNGRGGFWLQVAGEVNSSMRLELNGVELATHFKPGVITASLEPEYMEQVICRPGDYELALLDKSRQLRQSVGALSVLERPPAAVLKGLNRPTSN